MLLQARNVLALQADAAGGADYSVAIGIGVLLGFLALLFVTLQFDRNR